MRSRQPTDDEALLRLTRWQCTGVLLGVAVISMIIFFAGVVVGKQLTSDPLPAELLRIAAPAPSTSGPTTYNARSRAFAEVSPTTRAIDKGLSRPLKRLVPRDPTDAARIETHRQLSATRHHGVAGKHGVPIEGSTAPLNAIPTEAIKIHPDAVAQTGFTLQVSAFEGRGPADIVSKELSAAGHPCQVRQVRAGNRTFFRVEVGHFDTAEAAGRFQREFERAAGYSTVLVAIDAAR